MLATERTQIHFVTVNDASQISDYYLRNREHLAEWEPVRPAGYHSLESWRERAAAQEACIEQGVSYHFIIRELGSVEIIGLCNLSNVVRGSFLACNLGYSVDHALQGKGFMHEALSAIIDFAFSKLSLHRVMANYMPHNERSARLLKRLGFEEEGRARDYLKIAGTWRDHILTSRINS